MTMGAKKKDLVVLTADKNIEFTIRGILERRESLDIRRVEYDVFGHPGRDPGCLKGSHDYLRPFINRYDYALVVFDREGCGRENLSRIQIEKFVENELEKSGWNDRASVIVIDPELEMWVWSDSPHVESILGWKESKPCLRDWLKEMKFLDEGQIKPGRPKEAMEKVLCKVGKSKSSKIFHRLSQKVSLNRCSDLAFSKLKNVLQRWFNLSPNI